jgi:hypothetical protein
LPDLRERLQGSEPPVRYLLHRMSREGLHAAITGPLALAGIEEPDREDLARAALKDVGDEPGELALLQMALWRTWSEAQGRGRDLVRAYIRIGRVEGALAQAAEEVFKHLSEEEQQRAETLFVRLIRPGEAGGVTRRVAHRDEFNAPTQALAAKLSEKEHWRLLASHEDTVEIAHEQLATQWLRYQRWITNNPGDPERGVTADLRGDDLRLLQQLIAETSRWQAVPSDGKGRYLATGANLELYSQLSGRRRAWLSDVECQFVQACNDAERDRIEREQAQIAERERLLLERAEAERVRAREQTAAARKAWWLAVGLLVALVAVGAFWFNARQATTQAQVDGDKARMALLTVQARRAAEGDTPDEVERAGALAMESIEIARKRNWPTEADAVDAARSALRRLPVAVRPQGSPVNALVVLPDGRLASGGRDGQIKIWPKNFDGKPELLPQDSPVYSLKVLGDGRLASGGRDGQIKIWPKNFDGKPEVLLAGGGLVSSLVMLKDGRLASGSQDGKIRLWPKDLAGEPKVLPQGSPGSRIASLMALGDGRLVSGGDDGTIRLWPKDFAGAPEVLLGEGGPVSSLVTLSDGRLAAGSHDGKIRLWYRDLVRPPQVLNQGSLVSNNKFA